jgi:hypothetical protein
MMYNLAISLDAERFATAANALLKKGAYVELTDKSRRTKKQNSYSHLLCGIIAMEIGESLDYVKEQYFKRMLNADIFCYKKKDPFLGEVTDTHSTKEIDKEQTRIAIDRLVRWMYEQGFHVPAPENEVILREIEIEMGRMEHFIGR